MEKTEFIRCPVCGNKTRDKIREDTILKNFPLYYNKFGQESRAASPAFFPSRA